MIKSAFWSKATTGAVTFCMGVSGTAVLLSIFYFVGTVTHRLLNVNDGDVVMKTMGGLLVTLILLIVLALIFLFGILIQIMIEALKDYYREHKYPKLSTWIEDLPAGESHKILMCILSQENFLPMLIGLHGELDHYIKVIFSKNKKDAA
jgi:hypothetical protein